MRSFASVKTRSCSHPTAVSPKSESFRSIRGLSLRAVHAFHVTRWDVFGYKPCSGITSPQREGAGPRRRLSPCPKKPPFAAHEIPARLALPLPPGSPGLWQARYNNARVAKTTREINSWLKKKKKKRRGGQNKKESQRCSFGGGQI